MQLRSKFRRRGLRLVSGTALFACAATHAANRAVGLVSLAAAEGARHRFIAVWRSPPLTPIFCAALAAHIVLDFAAAGAAVREAGGIPDQFVGDRVMAIFGMDTDRGTARPELALSAISCA